MQYASERGNSNEDGPKEFITLFKTCTRPKDGYKIEGICTRVIRIKEADCYKPRRLSGDDPTWKIIFVSNSAASMNLLGTSGFECLVQIGYPEEWIRQLLLPGSKVVTIAYPGVKEDCKKHLDQFVQPDARAMRGRQLKTNFSWMDLIQSTSRAVVGRLVQCAKCKKDMVEFNNLHLLSAENLLDPWITYFHLLLPTLNEIEQMLIARIHQRM